MRGAIDKRLILSHPLATIRSFGFTLFFRALFAPTEATFLSLLDGASQSGASGGTSDGIVDRCIGLERAANRIYARLAEQFVTSDPGAATVFRNLAEDEQRHADLLAVCRYLGQRKGKIEAQVAEGGEPVDVIDLIDAAELRLHMMEEELDQVPDCAGAFSVALELEISELNQIFAAIVAATNSPFVCELAAFRETAEQHLTYLAETIHQLAPGLAEECDLIVGQQLRTLGRDLSAPIQELQLPALLAHDDCNDEVSK